MFSERQNETWPLCRDMGKERIAKRHRTPSRFKTIARMYCGKPGAVCKRVPL